jgi:hypothetical protein
MIQLHGITSAGETPHASEKDAALAVVSEVAQEIDTVVERRVVRKIDLYLMPAMLIGRLYKHDYLGKSLTDPKYRIRNGVL